MVAIAIPAIEAAATRVLIGLGVGAVAAEASREVARSKREAADKAAATPLSRADACTSGDNKPGCRNCLPDRGAFSYRSTEGWSDLAIAYQQRIGGMPTASMAGHITEWKWMGVDFDGFESGQCLLKEAKARYDQFFDEFGDPKEWWKGDEPIMAEAAAQSVVAKPQPPVQLRWHFMQPMSYRFFSKVFSAMRLPIETVFEP